MKVFLWQHWLSYREFSKSHTWVHIGIFMNLLVVVMCIHDFWTFWILHEFHILLLPQIMSIWCYIFYSPTRAATHIYEYFDFTNFSRFVTFYSLFPHPKLRWEVKMKVCNWFIYTGEGKEVANFPTLGEEILRKLPFAIFFSLTFFENLD